MGVAVGSLFSFALVLHGCGGGGSSGSAASGSGPKCEYSCSDGKQKIVTRAESPTADACEQARKVATEQVEKSSNNLPANMKDMAPKITISCSGSTLSTTTEQKTPACPAGDALKAANPCLTPGAAFVATPGYEHIIDDATA